MIQVQIAATVLEDGVADNRWVLVDDGETPPPDPAQAAPLPGDALAVKSTPPPAAVPRRGAGIVLLAKLLVLAGALGGAWALSLAILQARATAGASATQAPDRAVAQGEAPTREGTGQALAPRSSKVGVAEASPSKRSKP